MNELFKMKQRRRKRRKDRKGRHFVVLGAGKTATDTVVFLRTAWKVPPPGISRVIPNGAWMLLGEYSSGPSTYPRALLDADNDEDKAPLAPEAKGQLVQLE